MSIYTYTNIGCDHAIGIKNQPVPIINPNKIQDDLIGKLFILIFFDTVFCFVWRVETL